MKTTNLLQFAAGAAMLAMLSATPPAAAQYVWIDDSGLKQFSDMPPPASIPASRILKQPGMPSRPAPDTAPDTQAPAAAPKTLAEQNAQFKKRRAEQAEKEKKAAEETRLTAEKSRNCERARDYQRTLQSGERIAQLDKNGERAFMTDEQRTQELRETSQILRDCQ